MLKVLLFLGAMTAIASAAPGENCTQCLTVVKYVDEKLKANATEQEIEEFVDKICAKIGPIEDECKSYVQQYVPEVRRYTLAVYRGLVGWLCIFVDSLSA